MRKATGIDWNRDVLDYVAEIERLMARIDRLETAIRRHRHQSGGCLFPQDEALYSVLRDTASDGGAVDAPPYDR